MRGNSIGMDEKLINNRKRFLENTVILCAMSTVAPRLLDAKSVYKHDVSKDGEAFTILFRSVSITDGNITPKIIGIM